MTHSAGGRCNRSNAGLPGRVSWQLTMSDVVSLAINVVQNGWSLEESYGALQGSEPADTPAKGGRPWRLCGDAQSSRALRAMLEEIYDAMLRANRREAARAVDQLTWRESMERHKLPPS